MSDPLPLRIGQILKGALFNEPVRVETDRATAEEHNLEWVTPGHPLVEARRRNTLDAAHEAFGKGACFYSLQHEQPARIDFYRARIVDGLGQVIHERLFAVEIGEAGEPRLQESNLLGNFTPADPLQLPSSPLRFEDLRLGKGESDARVLPLNEGELDGVMNWLNMNAQLPSRMDGGRYSLD